ncbi:helix-turn-helix domain-containing protein [Erysipelothrix sp. HDW6C]|uniref:LexA family protein n=1 Tax=Erysipelothrix sp. HDW6C TaxID=2714930 RepID=UPI0014089461|nr:S24 family peptidase [Erysipelothrix sp. HDW6C]QIK69770.1 helix-turn-helix domain-containing protein [Erysipelothrix sp. HDW6C]
MTLQELVAIFRERNGLSLEEVGDAVGVSKSTVSRWESGAIKKISKENQQRLSEVFSIDVGEYLDYYFFKPVLGVVKAGYDLLADQHIEAYEQVSKQDYDRGDYFLRVKGDSMIGSRIYDGDLIFVKRVTDVESGDIAVVLINGDEATVKKVVKKDNLLILEASNPDYETRYYNAKDVAMIPIQIIGKVLNVRVTF